MLDADLQTRTTDIRPIRVPAAGEDYVGLPELEDDGQTTTHAVQTILAPPDALYELWHKVSLIPRWQEFVLSVTPVRDGLSHWIVGDPKENDGTRIEFDSEITQDVKNERLSWRSLNSEVKLEGTVTFMPAANGRGTVVTLIQTTKLPGGVFGRAFASLGKRGPKQVVIENLRHFKQLAESGEIPSVEGQPHGPRGVSGGFKRWVYGETNATPPGTSDLR